MQYFDFKGESISALGFGTMRLPVRNGAENDIDMEVAQRMVATAMEHGVNYYDTAWGYHGGTAEAATGKLLAPYPRNSFYLATKFPGYDTDNFGKHEQIFEKQLENCGVDCFDFYLLHNVCELNIEHYLDEETYGTVAYFLKQRDEGRIGHLGFSTHGRFDTFVRFMEAYGEHMEFCQIQLNYMDWEFQHADKKVDYLGERGIPILVMEPLRGGNLIALAPDEMEKLEQMCPGRSTVDWALRYAMCTPGVMTVLSGMSTPEQLEDNIRIFEDASVLSADERTALEEIGKRMAEAKGVPCTACRYCTSHCPIELDIPWLLELYNEHLSREGFRFVAPMAIAALPDEKKPAACLACGACAAVCPQQIDIPGTLADLTAQLASSE